MISLPTPRPDQLEILRHPARVKTVRSGRRFGKTICAIIAACRCAMKGGNVGWLVPNVENAAKLWEGMVQVTRQAHADGKVNMDKRGRRVIFHTPNGDGFLKVYTDENPDAILGVGMNLWIIDECRLISETTYQQIVKPTMAETRGDTLLIGTPGGRKHWFGREIIRCESLMNEQGAGWCCPSWDNPLVDREWIEEQRRLMPDRLFRQEFMGELLDDGGVVFVNVPACSTARPWVLGPELGDYKYAKFPRKTSLGYDPGKRADAAVWTVLGRRTEDGKPSQLMIRRHMGMDYTKQVKMVAEDAKRWNCGQVWVDAGAAGDPVIELLAAEGVPVRRHYSTNDTKQTLVESLIVAFEHETIEVLNPHSCPEAMVQSEELEIFEMDRTPSGLIRYGAPDFKHDDTVMALALAWNGIAKPCEPRIRRM